MRFKRGLPFLVAAFVAPLLTSPLAALAQSQPACPGDTVVWENTSTHVYHLAGDKYFGKTKHGAYACKAAADKAGFHQAAHTGASGGSGAGKSSSASSSTSTSAGASTSTSTSTGSMSGSGKHHHHKGAKGAASPAPSPAST